MRTFPWPMFIGACFAAAALLPGFTAPAHAQQIVEFVSNTGQSTGSDGTLELRNDDSGAQAFTTGSNRTGYELESIVVVMDAFPTPALWTVAVKLWSSTATGEPDSELCTLTNPATLGAGELTFTNNNCATLERDTLFVVMSANLSSNQTAQPPEWAFTTSDSEDSGADAGWTISDDSYYRTSSTGPWIGSGSSLKIKVNGAYANKDREALVALYNATNGGSWRNDSKWNSTDPLDDWHGVTTNAAGRVDSLHLHDHFLSGSIPAALGDLTHLEYLNLGKNDNLTGSIPADLGDLTNLKNLNLSLNAHTGSIPADLGDLTSLEELSLANNKLTGSIPAALGDLTSLEKLNLFTNQLSGSIPAALGDLTNLTHLHLANNKLTGSIPAALGDLTSLEELFLYTNQLSGSIPAALGDLDSLKFLYLYFNSLSGRIPAALGDLTSLEGLELNNNSLTGWIPALGELTNLESLALNNNSLTGSIPAELGDLTNLKYLALSYNSLTGSIPAALGDLTDLEELYLHNNSLTGSIPAVFLNLRNLSNLYVDNDLCVPGDTAFQEWLEDFEDIYDFEGDSDNICTPPVATDDDVVTNEDTPIVIRVLANDSDVNPNTILSVTAVGTPRAPRTGTAAITAGSTTTVTYTPNANFIGTDTFSYTVSDGTDTDTGTGTVTVTVNAVNDPPLATDDAASVVQSGSVNINVIANDTDVENDPLSVSRVGTPTAPRAGTAAITAGSTTTVTYTPNLNFIGTDTFSYTVSDGTGTATGTVRITVTVPPTTVPTPPRFLKAVAGDGAVTLVWTAPASDGGSALRSYQYRQKPQSGSFDAWTAIADTAFRQEPATRYTVTGLRNGTAYTFQVRAVNDQGPSSASGLARATPLMAAPSELTARGVDDGVLLTWTPPATASEVRSYQYRQKPQSGSFGVWTAIADTAFRQEPATRYTVTGLRNGTAYTFQVRGVSAGVPGAASKEARATAAVTAGICGRTPAVRAALVAALADVGDCAAVTPAHLSAPTGRLGIGGAGLQSLKPGDFAGLTGLTHLDLRGNALTGLPPGLFEEVRSLRQLDLRDNQLTVFPFAVFAALPALTELRLAGNPAYLASVWVAPSRLTITRGDSGVYRMRLNTAPDTPEVTVSVAVDGALATISPVALTFTGSNWFRLQPVVVHLAEHEDAEPVTLRHTVSGYGAVATAPPVTVTPFEIVPAARQWTTETAIISTPSGGTYAVGERIVATVRFGAAVMVDTSQGTPTIRLSVGGVSRPASYRGGSGTRTLMFVYRVAAGDTGEVGVVEGSLALNGGRIEGQDATTVEASVLGAAVQGLTVEFARSISGRPTPYVWSAVTDTAGHVELTITSGERHRVSGYYKARARTAEGEVVGQWNSIPLNRARRQFLELTLGGGMRVVGVEPFAAAKAVAAPTLSGLAPNVPNPFNSTTQIAYRLAQSGPVRLELYNVLGQRLRTLVDRVQAAGTYQVAWDARDQRGAAVAAGVYMARLHYPGGRQTRRLLYLK